jgi:hypothetical protein
MILNLLVKDLTMPTQNPTIRHDSKPVSSTSHLPILTKKNKMLQYGCTEKKKKKPLWNNIQLQTTLVKKPDIHIL